MFTLRLSCCTLVLLWRTNRETLSLIFIKDNFIWFLFLFVRFVERASGLCSGCYTLLPRCFNSCHVHRMCVCMCVNVCDSKIFVETYFASVMKCLPCIAAVTVVVDLIVFVSHLCSSVFTSLLSFHGQWKGEHNIHMPFEYAYAVSFCLFRCLFFYIPQYNHFRCCHFNPSFNRFVFPITE